ncbi:MAG: ATP-binding protein [Campylobacteraceae bacterium 4484_166]|nr:MAG: ATP-binding protein [Campylobacteraceae bacterium 4484_166]
MRALALFSGGLDSLLAMKLVKDQNIDILAVYIDTGFGSKNEKIDQLKKSCLSIDVPLKVLDIKKDFLDEVLFDPKYGYGKNFNPCIDCHGFMFKHTKKLLKLYDASFMISGEVLGQRPMSQRKEAIGQVAKLSGDEDDIIVRPLSAKLLNITKPERLGWIDREKLLDIEGRSRARQLKLVEQFNITHFESPSGGCLLTDMSFSQRLAEFVKYDKLETNDIDTLKVGRHFRLENKAKLIIGRNQDDNIKMEKITNPKYLKFVVQDVPGPLCMIEKKANMQDKQVASKIAITYAKTKPNQSYQTTIDETTFSDTKFENKDLVHRYII